VSDGESRSAPPLGHLVCRPIGVIRSPFVERADAPRQTVNAQDARGTVELFPGHDFEHALSDLERFTHLWVIFWFHLNEGWRPKVLPPRSAERRGVFATRAPYRPNPIGLSVVKLERIDGLTLHVSALDMLDGTPVLDLKPYVPYADALSEAGAGWLENALDPVEPFQVEMAEEAAWAVAYLKRELGIELEPDLRKILELGPQQHPYRRIKKLGDDFLLAVKDWRARFVVEDRRIVVTEIVTGYRPRELVENPDPALDPHRAFVSEAGKRRARP
jgi:tRNA-Thr(GGU) m(6)t(6)A37 methyltransferase TsaA